MYPLPARTPVPVQHKYDNQWACQDLAGQCVLSLGGLPDTPPTWIWDLQMKGAHSRGWVSFQLRVAVGMHVESFKQDDKRTVPAAADYYLPSWYPEILQEHPILHCWVWISGVQESSCHCLWEKYWWPILACRSVWGEQGNINKGRHTVHRTIALSTMSNVNDHHVSTSWSSWRSCFLKALRMSAKYWHQSDDNQIYASSILLTQEWYTNLHLG